MSVIPPPPPARKSDTGCWKVGLIGCGILGGIGIILASVGFYLMMKSPMMQQAMASGMQAGQAQKQLKTVGKALDSYVADNSKYPNELKDLIPRYLPSEASLSVGVGAKAPRIWYKKPAVDASGDTVVLRTDVTPPVGPPIVPNAPPWTIKLRKDGSIDGMAYEYTDKFGNTQKMPIANQ